MMRTNTQVLANMDTKIISDRKAISQEIKLKLLSFYHFWEEESKSERKLLARIQKHDSKIRYLYMTSE